MTEFWLNNIQELVNKDAITKIIPSKEDSFVEQLNTLSRAIIVATFIAFVITRSLRFLLTGVLCLLAVIIVFKSKSKSNKKEGFLPGLGMPAGPGGMPGMPAGPGGMPGMPGAGAGEPSALVELEKQEKEREEMFKKREKENNKRTMPTKDNPLMNVLLPQIQDDPHRLPAAKSYEPKIEKKINKAAADPKLFGDLGDNISFVQSMRNFYTTASSTVPNSQRDFANFCYGNMASCKDNDYLQCNKNNERYTRF